MYEQTPFAGDTLTDSPAFDLSREFALILTQMTGYDIGQYGLNSRVVSYLSIMEPLRQSKEAYEIAAATDEQAQAEYRALLARIEKVSGAETDALKDAAEKFRVTLMAEIIAKNGLDIQDVSGLQIDRATRNNLAVRVL